MVKKKKVNYWGIYEGSKIIYDGTFNECWERLMRKYGSWTLTELENDEIRIGRIG